MTKWLQRLIMAVILVWLGIVPAINAQDIDYNIIRQDITAQISSDGSVKFTDKQEVKVKFFNGMIFDLDRQGYDVRDYKVGIIDPFRQELVYFEENATGAPETFQLTQSDSTYSFKVFYPTSDQTVTFVFEYTLASLVTNFSDTAELNRKIVGSMTDEYLDVDAMIVLPGRVQNSDDFRAWAHGAPQGQVELTEYEGKSAVSLSVKDNPPNQFVEVNILLPTSLTPNNPNKIEVNKKAEIIAREDAQVLQDLEAYQSKLGWVRFGSMLLALLMPLYPLGVVLYYRRTKNKLNPNPVKLPQHHFELPEEITPALMATSVYRIRPNSEDFTATVVDLARKGYLVLEEKVKEKRGIFTSGEKTTILVKPGPEYKNRDNLRKHELCALEFVTAKSDQPLSFQELEQRVAKSEAFAKQQSRLWTRFMDVCQVVGEQLKGSTSEGKRPANMAWAGVFLLFGAAIILTSIIANTPYAYFIPNVWVLASSCWFTTLGMAIFMGMRPILTAEQDKKRQEWDGFKRMLSDIGNMKMRDIASLPLWEEYLVYAISLGVAEKVIDAMRLQFNPLELSQMRLGPTMVSNPYLYTRMMNHSLQNSIRTSNITANPAKFKGTNIGGFGGGFSGGSSGGSGGGSGSRGF